MTFPHPEPRQEHDGEEDESRRGCIVRKDLERTIDVTDDWNGTDDVNPADDQACGGVVHDGCYLLFVGDAGKTLNSAGLNRSAPAPAPDWRRSSATRRWRRQKPASDRAGNRTAPCEGACPCPSASA